MSVIAEELEEDVSVVERICQVIKKCGDISDVEKIYALLKENE